VTPCLVFSSILKMDAQHVPLNRRLTFNGLYGVIAEKTELTLHVE
jgi:hypothetical protein